MVGVSNANVSKKVLADDRRNPRSTEQWSYFATCSSMRIRFYKYAITKCYYMLTPQSITWQCPNGESRMKETMQNMHSMSRNGILVEEWHIDTNNSIGFRRLLLCSIKSQSIKYTLEAD